MKVNMDKIIEEFIRSVDFEAVHKIFVANNWKWFRLDGRRGGEIPSAERIRNSVIDLSITMKKKCSYGRLLILRKLEPTEHFELRIGGIRRSVPAPLISDNLPKNWKAPTSIGKRTVWANKSNQTIIDLIELENRILKLSSSFKEVKANSKIISSTEELFEYEHCEIHMPSLLGEIDSAVQTIENNLLILSELHITET